MDDESRPLTWRRDDVSFTEEEIEYLRSQSLARVATVGVDGQPDVVPLAFEFDGTAFWVGGSGAAVLDTRKFRNICAGQQRVALVVDDFVSFDPFVARGIRVYGLADPPVERAGMVGPGIYARITPTVSWSWNMAGEPVGATWYPARRTLHT
jgi:pyridoxamine 5'-phosphate oxidase family protein